MCNLLDCRAGTRSGAQMDGRAKGSFIEQELRDGAGDKIDGHNVEYRVRISRDCTPKPSCIDFQRPVHHFEAGSDASFRVSHNDAGAKYHAGQRSKARLHQGLGLGLRLFVGVAITLADSKLVFADQARPFTGYVGCTDISETSKLARAARKIENMPGALDIDAACFVERMIEPHRGGRVNNPRRFSRKARVISRTQPAVGLADVSGKNLNARSIARGDKGIGALLSRLACSVSNEQSQ